MRYFNIAGPCNKESHYMIEASSRLKGIERLIDMGQYFVIHAARQSGKTTFLLDLTKKLNNEGKYYTIYCSLEFLQGIGDAKEGIPLIIKSIKNSLTYMNIPNAESFAQNADYDDFAVVLNSELKKYCEILDKPLVLLFDEADCVSDSTLISFLRQLREGYITKQITPFVHSVALVGMRNIRDYKAKVRPDRETLGSASPFNIVTKALTLKNFTKEEIIFFYNQHTEDTGQIFDKTAIDFIYERTQGQPWLVNAVAREVIEEILQFDYTKPVTVKLAEEAIQTIILRRDTHIDSLLERLREERVRKIIEPLIMGGNQPIDRLSDDYQYVCDLGLITKSEKVMPSNPIYGEVIARYLSFNYQNDFGMEETLNPSSRYLHDNQIDMDKLMRDFQQFWRENSDIWRTKYQYQEAAPHLILMAFLQRIVNGGGQIFREMAAGTGRTDICIVFEGRKYPVELKIRRGDKSLQDGLRQTAEYMDTYGCTEGWLALFDQRPEIDWNEKIFIKKENINEKTIHIIGL